MKREKINPSTNAHVRSPCSPPRDRIRETGPSARVPKCSKLSIMKLAVLMALLACRVTIDTYWLVLSTKYGK